MLKLLEIVCLVYLNEQRGLAGYRRQDRNDLYRLTCE